MLRLRLFVPVLGLVMSLSSTAGAQEEGKDVETGLAAVNGVELHYEMMGQGPPLLLVHGFRHDMTTWDGLFEQFAEDYRVLRYDLAGHGKSTRPPNTEVGFRNLRALLEHFGIEKTHIVAHGMGGRIALDFALEYPEMVDRLIVVSAGMAGFPFSSELLMENTRKMVEAHRAGDLDTTAEYFTRSWCDGPKRTPEEVDPAVRAKCYDIVRRTIEPGRRAGIAAMPDPPTVERLEDIAVPLLVIVGAIDQPDLHAIADALIEQVNGAKRVIIPGVAHMPQMEKPEAFMTIALPFLAEGAAKTGYVKIDDAELYYEVMGEGDPLVLMHGGGLNCTSWDDQFAPLAAHYRVIRYDTRSHGRSKIGEAGFSDHEDLRALLDALGVEKAHLVGLSMGGRIAIDFALAHPDRVRSLIPVGPGLSGYPLTGKDWHEDWKLMIEAIERQDFDTAIEMMLRSWTDGPKREPEEIDPEVRQRVKAMLAGMLRPDRLWIEGRPLDPPAFARLDSITAPTLAIVGDLDQPEILEIVDMLCRTIDGAEKVVIPGAAHMVNMEQPEKFNRAVIEFIDGLEAREEN